MTAKAILTVGFFVWHIAATGYFGWNFVAESADEILVDGIALLGMAILWGKGN
ncbi:MAG: hypothetical protein GY943_05265 [Chloroflexi bacterium]|nr:hypothetical protein [Chloroflexota bacterium]